MRFDSSGASLQAPDQLNARFGVVAGLYVAAIVSPALLFVVLQRVQLRSGLVALGVLAAVGTVLTAVVGWQATRRGELVVWLNSPWLALLAPTVGLLPLAAYAFEAFVFVASSVAGLQPESAVSLVGFVGVLLGLVASLLGSVLVHMARTRMATVMVDDSDIAIEWTAGWTPQDRIRFVGSVLTVYLGLSGLIYWSLQWELETGMTAVTTVILPVGAAITASLTNVGSKRTYRVSPAGLETLETARWVDTRRITVWSQFEGFSVTNRTIVLHCRFPRLDVRCSRRDLIADEDDVIAALETHLDRHGSYSTAV